MLETLLDFLGSSGFGHVTIPSLIMIGVGIGFITLAIKKGYEPLLLVPIGFGMLIGNIPYNAGELSLGVYDGPADEAKLDYYSLSRLEFIDPYTDELRSFEPYQQLPKLGLVRDIIEADANKEFPRAVMVHSEEYLSAHGEVTRPGVRDIGHGHKVYVPKAEPAPEASERAEAKPALSRDGRYNVVIEAPKQNTFNSSVMWLLFRGIEWGFYPPLIFLGVGALTDFGPLLANPRTILLGAAAQFGIFGAMLMAMLLGFNPQEAGSIGIIGGADGPTAIFTCTKLAPHLLGAVALAAYSYMAMVPIIQPPIMKLLTTKAERRIRMEAPKDVSRRTRIIFPIAAFLLTAFIANGALPLLGMLFFGNLLRESMVTRRLAETAQTTFVDIVTILLGLTVGAKTQAGNFLTVQTIYIFVLGIVAFSVATATGLLFAKLMNKMSKRPINPLIGAAGVSAVPMAARVVQKVAHEEDPQNFLLMHAMGPNVAGVIGSAVAAGVLLSSLGGG